MTTRVKVLKDSVAPCGKRLTTVEATYWRGIHSEFLTHGLIARNSASSRAIPVPKLMKMIQDDPFIPLHIGANQKGMQAGEELPPEARALAEAAWLKGRDYAVATAQTLLDLGVHKQIVNRAYEPWMWITIIASATELTNFFALRDHPKAEPHMQDLARAWRVAMEASTPQRLQVGEWHLPLIDLELDLPPAIEIAREQLVGVECDLDGGVALRLRADEILRKVSVGRCGRVSYLTHDGRRDLRDDIRLHNLMVSESPVHASAAEHAARALDWPKKWAARYPSLVEMGVDGVQTEVLKYLEDENPPLWVCEAQQALAHLRSGRFLGFRQYRKLLPNEHAGGAKP